MKKLIILAALLVFGALGWIAATYMVATQVEESYFSFLQEHRQWGPVTLTPAGYQRGFLSSRAETLVDIALAEHKSLRLKLIHTMRHGPLPAWRTPDGEIRLEPMLVLVETRLARIAPGSEKPEDLLSEIPELKQAYTYTHIGLSGGGLARAYIPPFQTQVDDGRGIFDWQGLAAQADFTQGISTLKGFLTLSGLNLDSPEGRLHLGRTNSNFDLYQAFPDVFLGESDLQIDELGMSAAADEGPAFLHIDNIEMTAESRRNEEKVSYDQALRIAGMRIAGSNYGPGVLETSMRGLDGRVLSQIQNEMQQLQEKLAGLAPEEIAGKVLPAYLELLSKLLQGVPEFEVRNLRAETPQGDLEGRALLRFDGSGSQASKAPEQWLQALQADARLEIAEELLQHILAADLRRKMLAARDREEFPPFSDKEIAELAEAQAAKQIEALIQQNLLVRRDNELVIEAAFDESTLLLNGRPLSWR